MANQYSGSFEHIIREKFGCSAKSALMQCADKEYNYAEAADYLGFKPGTIRKWAKRYDVRLKSGEPPRLNPEQFMKFFKDKAINKYNVLSRRWVFIPNPSMV